MILALVMTHGDLGRSLLSTAEMIMGEMDGFHLFAFYSGDSIDLYREQVNLREQEVEGAVPALFIQEAAGHIQHHK